MLAAGRGLRFEAVTRTLPKSLLPLLGRPLLAWQLDALRAAGVREVVLVVGHLRERIEALLADGHPGLELATVTQPRPLGIAAALTCAAPRLVRPFLCVLGDVYFDPSDLARLGPALVDADAALVARPHSSPGELARNFAVEVEAGGWVRSVEEKPDRTEAGWKGIGLYAFRPGFLPVAAATPPSGLRGERELTDAIARHLAAGARVRAVASRGADVNVSGPADLLAANLLALEREGREAWIDPRAEIGAGARIERSVVLAEASVAAGARLVRSLVLPGQRVVRGDYEGVVFAAGEAFARPGRA